MAEVSEERAEKAKGESGGGLLRGMLLILVFVWILRSLVAAPFSIPSGSMLPGLYIGDYLLVSKWNYGYGRVSFLFGFPPIDGRLFAQLPERGDVVVFRGPAGNDVIKRVIGLPGDTVGTTGGQIVLNGAPVARRPAGRVAIPVSANSPCRAALAAGSRPDGVSSPLTAKRFRTAAIMSCWTRSTIRWWTSSRQCACPKDMCS